MIPNNLDTDKHNTLSEPPWCPRLECWLQEALKEAGNATNIDSTKRYAIFPQRLVDLVARLDQRKKYDFCFMGAAAIRPKVKEARQWIFPFVRRHFGARSYLLFTDNETKRSHTELGTFDFTLRRNGFVPRSLPIDQRGYLEKEYYEVMCKSQFALCPAGDQPWSMRFYEALLCGAIPVVRSLGEAARTPEEGQLGYKFYLVEDVLVHREDWVEHNRRLFRAWHTVSGIAQRR